MSLVEAPPALPLAVPPLVLPPLMLPLALPEAFMSVVFEPGVVLSVVTVWVVVVVVLSAAVALSVLLAPPLLQAERARAALSAAAPARSELRMGKVLNVRGVRSASPAKLAET